MYLCEISNKMDHVPACGQTSPALLLVVICDNNIQYLYSDWEESVYDESTRSVGHFITKIKSITKLVINTFVHGKTLQ